MVGSQRLLVMLSADTAVAGLLLKVALISKSYVVDALWSSYGCENLPYWPDVFLQRASCVQRYRWLERLLESFVSQVPLCFRGLF